MGRAWGGRRETGRESDIQQVPVVIRAKETKRMEGLRRMGSCLETGAPTRLHTKDLKGVGAGRQVRRRATAQVPGHWEGACGGGDE